MFKRLKHLMLVALCCVSCAPTPKTPKTEKWVVYYGDTQPAEAFLAYDVVLFDRMYHPPLAPLLEDQDRIVLAYVSVGEIHGFREAEIRTLKKEKALLKANKQWGSHIVNLTSATWRSMVMADIQDALDQGFHGVMLDTIDTPLQAAAEQSDELGKANHEAAIQLISDIRQTFPTMAIMLNRGFPILNEVSQQLDFTLAESILSETNVSTGQSKLFPPMTYREMTSKLQDAVRKSPKLRIYTLDYWKPDDVEGIKLLYALHRANGYVPYVTTPDLRTLTPEPHSRQNTHRTPKAPVEDIGREEKDA